MTRGRAIPFIALCAWLLGGQPTEAASLTLTWDPPDDGITVGYVVWCGTASGSYDKRVNVGYVTSYQITGLTDTTTYYCVVRAYNATNDMSPVSAEVVGTTGGGNPENLAAPYNLTATVRDGRWIDLAWQAPATGAPAYRIEIGTAAGRTDVTSLTTGVTTSFSIADLPLRTYFIRVRSASDLGMSAPSNEVVVAGTGGPDAPRRLSAAVVDGATVQLLWNQPEDLTGITGYVVEAGSAPGRSDLGSIPTTGLSFTSPAPRGTYFVRVRSLKGAVAGSASNEVVAHVGDNVPCTVAPGPPELVARAIGTFVELRWSPGAGDAPTGYTLDVGSAPGRHDVATVRFDAATTTFTSPAPNGTYAFRLTAVNACGASTWAPEAVVTIGNPATGVPDAPTNLTRRVSGQSVTLAWMPPLTGGAPTRYIIEAVDSQGRPFVTFDTGNLATMFLQSNVPPGQYVVRVKAANAAGVGPASSSVTVVVSP